MAGRDRKARLGWVLLFGTLVLLRAPALVVGPVDIDETDFLVMGRMVAQGALPYLDTVDKKPVLTYLFYAPAGAIGFHMWPVQLLCLVWLFGTCVVLGRACARWVRATVGSDESADQVGCVAGWIAGLVSCCNAISVSAEVQLNLPVALALLFFVRAETGTSSPRRDHVASGLFIGIATLFKHQAGIVLCAFELALIWQWHRKPGAGPQLGRHAAMLFGFAAPWLAVAGFYAGVGHLAEFYEWNIARNIFLSRAAAGSALARFAEGVGLFVVAGAGLVWFAAVREATPRRDCNVPDEVRSVLAILLALTWLPVALGGRFYNHYFLQFVPPLSLLAAPQIAVWLKAHRRATALALAAPAAVFFVVAVVRGVYRNYPAQEPKTVALGAWLRENTRPDERLFVWGHYSPVYYLAERLPGTRYHITAVHMGDFDPHHLPDNFDFSPYISERDVGLTLLDLDRNRPAIVVDTAPANIHDWSRVPLAKLPALDRYVREHYALVGRPGGAAVYRRRN